MAKSDQQFDFHKVSENADVEVYQAMQRYKTKESIDKDGNKLPAPRKYGPVELKSIDAETLASALDMFDGYDVDQVSISKQSGITVRVNAPKGEDWEAPEPDVARLEVKKAGDK